MSKPLKHTKSFIFYSQMVRKPTTMEFWKDANLFDVIYLTQFSTVSCWIDQLSNEKDGEINIIFHPTLTVHKNETKSDDLKTKSV